MNSLAANVIGDFFEGELRRASDRLRLAGRLIAYPLAAISTEVNIAFFAAVFANTYSHYTTQ